MVKTTLQKLEKKADSLWSECVRLRDKKCVLCGRDTSLQAHHWIVTRKQSYGNKYNLKNGVTLCYGCHIHGIHSNPSVYLLDRLKDRCISLGIATQNDIEEIKASRHEVVKKSVSRTENIITALETFKELHSGDADKTYGDRLQTIPANSGE